MPIEPGWKLVPATSNDLRCNQEKYQQLVGKEIWGPSSDILPEIGEENLFGNIDDALNRARDHLGLSPLPRPAGATATVARETPTGNSRKLAQDS